MAQPPSAAARLRKTFQYPTDDDETTGAGEALDEEEQDTLISTLSTQNTETNTLYTRLFLILCVGCSTLYIPSLFPFLSSSNNGAPVLPALLALTSLGCSAWVLVYLPPGTSGIRVVDDLFASAATGGAKTKGKGRAGAIDSSSLRSSNSAARFGAGSINSTNLPQLGQRIDKSPLELYIPYMNLVLVGLVAVAGWLLRGGGGLSSGEAWNRLGLVPGVVYGLVIVGKGVMGGVEPGMRELEGLRYGFKGA